MTLGQGRIAQLLSGSCSHTPRTRWLQICRKPLLPPEDTGRAELAPAQAAGSDECPLPSPHRGNDTFSGKRRENHSLDRLSPHCSQQGRLHHPQPSAAKGSHCQLEAQAAPGWEWVYVPWGAGHHRKKPSLEKRQENILAKQGEPQGDQSVTGGFILLPQTEGFILEWHREFSVLCLFQESLHGTTVGAHTLVSPFGFEPFLPAREFPRK